MQIVSKQLYSLCKHTFCKNHTHFIIEMVLSFSKPLFLTSIKLFRIPTPNVKPQFVQHSSCDHFPQWTHTLVQMLTEQQYGTHQKNVVI